MLGAKKVVKVNSAELPLKAVNTRAEYMDQINDCGLRAASHYEGLTYWTYNWRKKGGAARMYEISKEENFYKQEYCGCVYSLRDTNLWRKKSGRKPIHFGQEFYHLEEQ